MNNVTNSVWWNITMTSTSDEHEKMEAEVEASANATAEELDKAWGEAEGLDSEEMSMVEVRPTGNNILDNGYTSVTWDSVQPDGEVWKAVAVRM